MDESASGPAAAGVGINGIRSINEDEKLKEMIYSIYNYVHQKERYGCTDLFYLQICPLERKVRLYRFIRFNALILLQF